MALTKVTGQIINTSTDVTVGVLTVTNTLAVGGTVSIGGTLTYEDVTNIDSVGLITARNGVNITGGNITLGDSGGSSDDRIVFGAAAGGDLSIFHNGNHSKIVNNTGELRLDGDSIKLKNKDEDENYITCTDTAGVQLYYTNNLKLSTSSTGISITGIPVATQSTGNIGLELHATGNSRGSQIKLHNDHGTVYFGQAGDTTGDLLVYNESNTNIKFYTNGNNERLRIHADGTLSLGTGSSASAKFNIAHGNEFALYTSGPYNFQAKFESTDAEAAIVIEDSNSGTDYNRIGVITNDMTFITNNSERLRIGSTGVLTSNVSINGQAIHTFKNMDTTASSSAMTIEQHFNFNRTGGGVNLSAAKIIAGKEREWVGAASNQDGYFAIHTTENETSAERLRIDSSGRILVAGGNSYHADADDLVLKERSGGNVGMTFQNTSNSNVYGVIYFGDSDSPNVGRIQYDHSNDSLDLFTNGSERVNIASDGRFNIGNSSAGVTGNKCQLTMTHNNTNGLGLIDIDSYGSATLQISSNWTGSTSNGVTNESFGFGTPHAYPLVFVTSGHERFRIYSGGNVSTTGDTGFTRTTAGFTARKGDSVNIARASGTPLEIVRTGNTGNMISFFYGSSGVASISYNGSTMTYGGTSDYRLKENIVEMTGGIDAVKKLKPIKFNFIATPERTVEGFIAHEVQEVIPQAVTGEKDCEVDEEGIGYQQLDPAQLVPTLTTALQEAITRIETLEAEVAALKSN